MGDGRGEEGGLTSSVTTAAVPATTSAVLPEIAAIGPVPSPPAWPAVLIAAVARSHAGQPVRDLLVCLLQSTLHHRT